MSSRGRRPSSDYHRRPIETARSGQSGSYRGSGRDDLPEPDSRETTIAAQASKLEQLACDNRVLTSSQNALREDLVAAQQELEGIKAQFRSIQSESDIQIRVILEKLAKMEGEMKNGEIVKQDLHMAHMEVVSIVEVIKDIVSGTEKASQELEKTKEELQVLPDLLSELDNLRQEHERIRTNLVYETAANREQTDQLKAKENKVILMVQEVQRLRAEIANVENMAIVPNPSNSSFYSHHDPAAYPSPMVQGHSFIGHPQEVHSTGIYHNGYAQIGVAPTVPYFNTNGPPDVANWAGPYQQQ